jgi:hypothetical protein
MLTTWHPLSTKVALTSLTSSGHSISIVRSQTRVMEFSFFKVQYCFLFKQEHILHYSSVLSSHIYPFIHSIQCISYFRGWLWYEIDARQSRWKSVNRGKWQESYTQDYRIFRLCPHAIFRIFPQESYTQDYGIFRLCPHAISEYSLMLRFLDFVLMQYPNIPSCWDL